ncbi:metal-sensitive transcriptional regulator [Candidatus Bipolaricaulota bacterium]
MHEHRREPIKLRLKKAQGHVGAVLRMVEEGRDCPEILLQISAVRAALTQIGVLVLEDHLDSCLVDAIEAGSAEEVMLDLKESLERFVRSS